VFKGFVFLFFPTKIDPRTKECMTHYKTFKDQQLHCEFTRQAVEAEIDFIHPTAPRTAILDLIVISSMADEKSGKGRFGMHIVNLSHFG
jgi:hypothetical protein